MTSDIRMHMDICNRLQQTATDCNRLQQTATDCNTLQHTATHCNTLQHTATNWYEYLRTDIRRRTDIRLFNAAQPSWKRWRENTQKRTNRISKECWCCICLSALCMFSLLLKYMSIVSINIHDINIDIDRRVTMVHWNVIDFETLMTHWNPIDTLKPPRHFGNPSFQIQGPQFDYRCISRIII